jgi:tape measure domain-containing protein
VSSTHWVDRAWVGILPDFSRFASETNRGILGALRTVDAAAGQLGGRIEGHFDQAAKAGARSFDGMRTDVRASGEQMQRDLAASAKAGGDSFDRLRSDVRASGAAMERDLRGSAQASGRALEGIGRDARGRFLSLQADAERTGAAIEREFEETGRDSRRALQNLGLGAAASWRVLSLQAHTAGASISRAFRETSLSAGTALAALRARAFGAGALIAGVAVTMGGALAKMGLDAAASMEQAQISFSQLLGSGKAAKDFLAELNEFAARTPFELPGLVASARQLLGAGQAAKDIIPTLTAVGDATGALGLQQDAFQRIMLAVTQAMNKGRIQGEELMQMQEAGLPVIGMLARALGVQESEVSKLAESGKLMSDQVLPKLFSQMQKDYGGAMGKQAQTLNGLWSTFMDTVRNGLRTALEPMVPLLKDALPAAGAAAGQALEGVAGFFRAFIPELDRVRNAWDENRAAIFGFLFSVQETEGQMLTTTDAARGLADGLTKLIGLLGDAATLGMDLAGVFNFFKGQINDAHGAAEDMSDVIGQLFGLRAPPEIIDWFRRVTGETEKSTDATRRSISAREVHAAAVQTEKDAIRDLNDALAAEKSAELGVRQAKVNVARAQERLTELRRQGKEGTTEYEQAQIDLERAQLNLTEQTNVYRGATRQATSATRDARQAAQGATNAYDNLKGASFGAAKQMLRTSDDMNRAVDKLRSKTMSVTAKYDIGAPRGIALLIEKGLAKAAGGVIRGPGSTTSDQVPVLASDQEHMVAAREVLGLGGGSYQAGHQALQALRGQWRRRAQGGPVLDFREVGRPRFLASPPRFDRAVVASMEASAKGFGRWIEGAVPQIPVGGLGPGGAAVVGRLGQWIAQAIALTGVPGSWAPALARRAMFESAGNPGAINLWDINAQRGTPSMGLMQTIGPTFNAYKLPGFGNVWNPVHNLIAAIRYIKARYGSIFVIDPPVRGYDVGGLWPPGTLGVNLSGGPERVLNREQTAAWAALERAIRPTTVGRGAPVDAAVGGGPGAGGGGMIVHNLNVAPVTGRFSLRDVYAELEYQARALALGTAH